jgi:hypothetical protein
MSAINETKIFDPADGFSPFTDVAELTDATVAKRGDQWWMYLAGEVNGHVGIQLFSASLPAGTPLAATGWRLTPHPHDPKRVAPLATHELSKAWDLKGGRHCPSYVKGRDPQTGNWIERIYYAGAAENLWGPYAIGYLEWDGSKWADQSDPIFIANEDWERGSVYEPNLIYANGMWKMWYVAGSNKDDYLIHGFAESADGRTGWSTHQIFIPPSEKVFDFCVRKAGTGYEAIFSRVWLSSTSPPSGTGLWWCQCNTPSSNFSDWSQPIQIMTAQDIGWHAGPWKPTFQFCEADPDRRLVFFDGSYKTSDPGPFPYAFTLGCLEIRCPLSTDSA